MAGSTSPITATSGLSGTCHATSSPPQFQPQLPSQALFVSFPKPLLAPLELEKANSTAPSGLHWMAMAIYMSPILITTGLRFSTQAASFLINGARQEAELVNSVFPRE